MNREIIELDDGSFHSENKRKERRRFVKGGLAATLLGIMGSKEAFSFELFKTFQTPEAFLQEAFGSVPPPKALMLDNRAQSTISAVFDRKYPQSRLRYWERDGRTAWVFDDIGKQGYVPTTCGFVIKDGQVEFAKVLIYRESRGEQVAEPSFLRQLMGAKASGKNLDRQVDNISGATLSVEMMVRMSRTAIAMDSLI